MGIDLRICGKEIFGPMLKAQRVARFAYRNLGNHRYFPVLKFFVPGNDLKFFLDWTRFRNETQSKSQLGQEYLPFFFGINFGYFCEVGANDGLRFSNTFYLESIGWNGVLIEPDPRNASKLMELRRVNILPYASTDADDITLTLNMAPNTLYSSIIDSTKEMENLDSSYVSDVKGYRLDNLLKSVKAPRVIDLITIDTEGNELEVLHGMDFEKYEVKIICVEHNYNLKKLSKVKSLLLQLGFNQILPVASQYDAWFINTKQF
jgi:FkbM family methyltransferase